MVRSFMSVRARREVLAQVGPRYQEARGKQKSQILNEFVATTGYARQYAIRLLSITVPLAALGGDAYGSPGRLSDDGDASGTTRRSRRASGPQPRGGGQAVVGSPGP
jgi:hypothetical protein